LQNCCIYYRELKSKGWIAKDKAEIVLIKGFPAAMCTLSNPEPKAAADQPDQTAGEVLNFNTKTADYVLKNNTTENSQVLNTNTEIVLNFNTSNNKDSLTSHLNQQERELNEERGAKLGGSSAPHSNNQSVLSSKQEKSEPIRLPDDFVVTPEMELWCRDTLPLLYENLDLSDLTTEFCNYWNSEERGEKGFKADLSAWIAAWKNDMTRKQQFLKKDLKAADIHKPKQEKKHGIGKQTKSGSGADEIKPVGDRSAESSAGAIAEKYGARPAGIL